MCNVVCCNACQLDQDKNSAGAVFCFVVQVCVYIVAGRAKSRVVSGVC